MTKRLCDICGKEIINDENEYNISIDSPFMRAKYLTVIPDVCSDCANSIYHYIEGLKSLLTNQLNRDNIYDKEVM